MSVMAQFARVAAGHVPAAGVRRDREGGGLWCGAGIAHAALQVVDDHGGECDLVLVAVPAGAGAALAAKFRKEAGRVGA